jgi:S-adenosylmethionine synthetase
LHKKGLKKQKRERKMKTMFEKVNPAHPDKVADRIAGAIVDLAYTKEENPKVAVEVLIGHGLCTIIGEISAIITRKEVRKIVERITGKKFKIILRLVPQDKHLAKNQEDKIRCGDNGIFKGVPVTKEQRKLTDIAYVIYSKYKSDGKYILDGNRLIICQSNAKTEDLKKDYHNATINPLGDWTGGTDVDTGATNRKLGSDMADSVTGGGLHGKDLSKADVSVNIYAWLKAQNENRAVELCCAIGDETVDGRSYSEIVRIARDYISAVGGFEKFSEWGLIRPNINN